MSAPSKLHRNNAVRQRTNPIRPSTPPPPLPKLTANLTTRPNSPSSPPCLERSNAVRVTPHPQGRMTFAEAVVLARSQHQYTGRTGGTHLQQQ